MWSTRQPAQAVKKSRRYWYGLVPLQEVAGPQKFTAGDTSRAPAALALVSSMGQSVAACCAVRLDCAWKLGSLKPSRYRVAGGSVAPRSFVPQIMGTNSSAGIDAAPAARGDQSYHQPTDGRNGAPGAVLVAMPRLQMLPVPASAPPPPLVPL